MAKGPNSTAVVQLAMDINALSVRGNHDHEVVRQGSPSSSSSSSSSAEPFLYLANCFISQVCFTRSRSEGIALPGVGKQVFSIWSTSASLSISLSPSSPGSTPFPTSSTQTTSALYSFTRVSRTRFGLPSRTPG